MEHLNQLTENELYDLIMKTNKLPEIRPFIEIAREFDESIYTKDWNDLKSQFKTAKTRTDQNKLKEPLARKLSAIIYKNIELEENDDYESPTAEKVAEVAEEYRKKLGLKKPKSKSPKAESPKAKAESKYDNVLDKYTDEQKEKALQSIMKTVQNNKSSEKLMKYLNKLQKETDLELLENLDKDSNNSTLLNATIYHYLKDFKKIKSRSPKKPKSKSPESKHTPKSPVRPPVATKSIYNDLVKGYNPSQIEEAKAFIKEKANDLSTAKLLKYLRALKTNKKVSEYLDILDGDTENSILLDASIYHTLKDMKKIERSGPKLEYLKQLRKGKKCDYNNPCDEGDCDLLSKMCVDETMSPYYEGMERRSFNGKYFLGRKETLDQAFPLVDEVKEEVKEEVVSEPEEEEVDLDIELKDLGKLTDLQRALVECLMPSTKP